MRTVVAPTNDATFGETPRRSRYSRYSPSVVQAISYLMSPWCSTVVLLHRVVERTHRSTFAQHLERDALADVALAAAVVDQRLVGPTEHVDEAGSDGQARRVDLQGATGRAHVADRRDSVVVNRKVADDRRGTSAVVDRTAANDDVVGGILSRADRSP